MTLFKLLLLISACVAGFQSQAREREREFKPGRGHGRGNERSERVNRLAHGEAVHRGNGCPMGSMRVVFAPDYLSFTVLYDQFIAETGGTSKRDVVNCEASVPIDIPDGMQMEITRVDLRGFVGLPERARADLQSVFNFEGRGSGGRMRLRYRFDGPVMDDYVVTSDVLTGGGRPSPEASPCGGRTNLQVSNQLKIKSGAPGENASVTIDSIDGSSNAIYYVNWRSCTKKGRR